MVVDVWSRKIVGWGVQDRECSELASLLITHAVAVEGADATSLALHQDNGAPMKGATLKATLEAPGVLASYSRPHVSDDNPYSESLFRTLKYCPGYPSKPFESIEHATAWVAQFVAWYNGEHFHNGIGFVTPAQRHHGRDLIILKERRAVYEEAKTRRPESWSRATRAWQNDDIVALNPARQTTHSHIATAQAA